jgi:hypothetical protein
MTDKKVSFTISAVNRSSEMLDKVNKDLAAFNAPVERVNKQFSVFLKQSGLETLHKRMSSLASAGLDVFRSVSRVVTPMAAITGVASVAGMGQLVEKWSELGSRAGFTAARIGVSVSSLSSFQGAARLAGGSAEGMASGLTNLGQTINDAIGGRAPEAVVMFNTLGIAFQDAAGRARPVTEVLPEIADKIKGIKDPFTQARIASTLLGGAAEDLLPFLRMGSKGMAEYADMARRYGVMSDSGAEAANRLRMAQVRTSLAVEGLQNSIAEKLAPVIGPLLTDMADWIAANRDWIATGIGDEVQEVAGWLRQMDWRTIGQDIRYAVAEVNAVVNAFGGWTRVAEILIGLKIAGWVAGLISPIASLVSVLARVPAAVGAVRTALVAARGAGAAAAVTEEAAAWTALGTEAAAPAAAGTLATGAATGAGAIAAPLAVAGGVAVGTGVMAATWTPEDQEKIDRANYADGGGGDFDKDMREEYLHPRTHAGDATDADRERWAALAKERAARGETYETFHAKELSSHGPMYQGDRTWGEWWAGQQGEARKAAFKKAEDQEKAQASASAEPSPDASMRASLDDHAARAADLSAGLPQAQPVAEMAEAAGIKTPVSPNEEAKAPAQQVPNAPPADDVGDVQPRTVFADDGPSIISELTVRQALQVRIDAAHVQLTALKSGFGLRDNLASTQSPLAPASEIRTESDARWQSAVDLAAAPRSAPAGITPSRFAPASQIHADFRPETRPVGGAGDELNAARAFAGVTAQARHEAGRHDATATQQLMQYFRSQGWSKAQSAGIVASGVEESGLRADAVGDGGHARGGWQWHEDRQAEFKRLYGKELKDASLLEQAAFVNHELRTGNEQRAGQRLAQAQTAASAGSIVSQFYERPADVEGNKERRGRLAERIDAETPESTPAVAVAQQQFAPPVAAPREPAFGPPVAPPPVAAPGDPGSAETSPVTGAIDVNIRHSNPPQGTVLTAKSSGNAFSSSPNVETSMSGIA